MDKYIGSILVSAFLVANLAMSSFAVDFSMVETDPGVKRVIEVVEIEVEEETKISEQEEFLGRLKGEFNITKTGYKQLLNRVADTRDLLELVTEEKMTLIEQLRNIDNLEAVTTKRLTDVVMDIVETENAIRKLYDEIEIREVALAYQKELLRDYLRVIYQEQDAYFTVSEDGGVDAFKLLLADGSVGENLQKFEYFDLLNEAGIQLLERLAELAVDLKNYQNALKAKKNDLVDLKTQLEAEKVQLETQKTAKQNLLNLTRGQEKVYGKLLEQTLREQGQVLADVKSLNDVIGFVEMKIAEEGDDFDPSQYSDLIDYRTKALYDFRFEYDGKNTGFSWPVDPDRGLSAYFRDTAYAGVFGVRHNAIDIPVYQQSPVRSTANGIVYTVAENGYGYSYIVIAHADGFSSVYGHMNSILVEEGQRVYAGSIIGLSGGMPGTIGAGYMTTGPHVHFELLLDGQHVDPLKYLPLDALTADQIEALPEKYYEPWAEQVLGMGEVLR